MLNMEMGVIISKLQRFPTERMFQYLKEVESSITKLPIIEANKLLNYIESKEKAVSKSKEEMIRGLFSTRLLCGSVSRLDMMAFEALDEYNGLSPLIQVELTEHLSDIEKLNIIKNYSSKLSPANLQNLILSLDKDNQKRLIDKHKDLIMKGDFKFFAIFVGALEADVQKHLIEVMQNNIKTLSNEHLANLVNYLYNANVATFMDLYFDKINSLAIEDFATMISSLGDSEILICCEKFREKFEAIPTGPLIIKFATSIDDPSIIYKIWSMFPDKLEAASDTYFNLIISRLNDEDRVQSLVDFKKIYQKNDINTLLNLFQEDIEEVKLKLFLEYPEKINSLEAEIFIEYVSDNISTNEYKEQISVAYFQKISNFSDEDFIKFIHSFCESRSRYSYSSYYDDEYKTRRENDNKLSAEFLIKTFSDRISGIKEENIPSLFKESNTEMQKLYFVLLNDKIKNIINNKEVLKDFISCIWGEARKELYSNFEKEFSMLTAIDWYNLGEKILESGSTKFGVVSKFLISCEIDNLDFMPSDRGLSFVEKGLLEYFEENLKNRLYSKWNELLNKDPKLLIEKYNEVINNVFGTKINNVLLDKNCLEALTLIHVLIESKLINKDDEMYNMFKELYITLLTEKLTGNDECNIEAIKSGLFYRIVKGSIKIIDLTYIKTYKGLIFANRNIISTNSKGNLSVYGSDKIEDLVEPLSEEQLLSYNLKLYKNLCVLIKEKYKESFAEDSSIQALAFRMFLIFGYDKTVKILSKTVKFTELESLFGSINLNGIKLDESGNPILKKKMVDFFFGNGVDDEESNISKLLSNKIPGFTRSFSSIFNSWDLLYSELNGDVTVSRIVKYFEEHKILLNPDEQELMVVINELGDNRVTIDKARSLYIDMKKRKFSSIPKVEGEYKDYTYEMLDLDNPLGLAVGYLTHCCFKIDGLSKTALFHSAQSNNGRIFVVRKQGRLVAQSWVWRNGNLICFDNVETTDTYSERELLEIYKEASKKLIEISNKEEDTKESVKLITFGAGYSLIEKPEESVRGSDIHLPLEEGVYSDAKREQFILAHSQNDDLYYGAVKAQYIDERKPVVKFDCLDSLPREQRSLIAKNLRAINYSKDQVVKEINFADYEYLCMNTDWYILISVNGEIESCVLSHDRRAKVEYASELLYIKDNLLDGSNLKTNAEEIKKQIKLILEEVN